MKVQVLLVVVICVVSLTCRGGSSDDFITQEYPKEQEIIKALVRQVFESIKTKELDKLEALHLYGPKFTKFSASTPGRLDPVTTPKLERAGAEVISDGTYSLNELKVDVFEKVAIATFIIEFDVQIGQNQVTGSNRSTLVFVKAGDDWKITHEHFSPTIPSP